MLRTKRSVRAVGDLEIENLSLLRIFRRTGSDGRRWVEEYSTFRELEFLKDDCLAALRKGRIDEGREILERIDRDLQCIDRPRCSIAAVLKRWYCAAAAYYFYLIEDYEAAEAHLEAGLAAIVEALEVSRFLLPLAHHCSELHFQRARIDRNRRCWRGVRQHIEHVRSILEDSCPYCTLPSGISISVTDLKQFYRNLELTREEETALSSFLDDRERLGIFDRKVREIFSLKNIVIPYP